MHTTVENNTYKNPCSHGVSCVVEKEITYDVPACSLLSGWTLTNSSLPFMEFHLLWICFCLAWSEADGENIKREHFKKYTVHPHLSIPLSSHQFRQDRSGITRKTTKASKAEMLLRLFVQWTLFCKRVIELKPAWNKKANYEWIWNNSI